MKTFEVLDKGKRRAISYFGREGIGPSVRGFTTRLSPLEVVLGRVYRHPRHHSLSTAFATPRR